MSRAKVIIALIIVLLMTAPNSLLTGAVDSEKNETGPNTIAREQTASRAPIITKSDNHNNTINWDFSDPSDYTTNNASVSQNNASLAEEPGTWRIIGPGARLYHAMAWDVEDNALIVHGGGDWNLQPMKDTWMYYPSNDTWVRKLDGPSLAYHTGVWDQLDKQMLVFGGWDGHKVTGDTWSFKPSTNAWTKLATNSKGKANHTAVWDDIDNIMLVFGGGALFDINNEIFSYNPATDTWSQRTSGATPRAWPTSAWDPVKKVMYIFGGYDESSVWPNDAKDLWAYSPSTDSWSRKADWTYQNQKAGAFYDTQSNKLVVHVPYYNPQPDFVLIIRYDPNLDSWLADEYEPYSNRIVSPAVWDPTANRMFLFSGHADQVVSTYYPKNSSWSYTRRVPIGGSSTVWDDQNDQMLVFNGQGTISYNETYAYSPATQRWTTKPLAPQDRMYGTTVWDTKNKRAFIFGGASYNFPAPPAYADLWMYTPSNGTWVRLADCPMGHVGHSAVWDTVREEMVVYGGFDLTSGNYLDGIYIYNYTMNHWTFKNPAASAPHMRADHTAVWDQRNGRMIIIGGLWWDGVTTHDYFDIWAYYPGLNSWTNLGIAPTATKTVQAVWDSFHERVVVLGGFKDDYVSHEEWYLDARTNVITKMATQNNFSVGKAVFDTENHEILVWGISDNSPGLELWAYGTPYYPIGNVTSKPQLLSLDLYSIHKIHINATVTAKTQIELSAHCSKDGKTWSDWEQLSDGGQLTNQSLYFQWRVTFKTQRPAWSPYVQNLSLDFVTNKKPVVTLKVPKTGLRKKDINISATVSDGDADPLTYLWSQTKGPVASIKNKDTKAASISVEKPGNVSIKFTVWDGFNWTNSSFNVSILDQGPVAICPQDLITGRNHFVDLNGSGTDPDGDALNYSWVQLEGPAITLLNTKTKSAMFRPVRPGIYSFQLTVDDGYGMSNRSQTQVTVYNVAPDLTVGDHFNAYVMSTVEVTANLSDAENDVLTVNWTKIEGGKATILSNDTATLSFIPLDPGKFVFSVVANDTFNDSTLSIVTVEVANRAPKVTVKDNIDAMVGDTVDLTSNATDEDGDTLSYSWEQTKGTHVSLLDQDLPNASFTPSQAGSYTFVITVSDTHVNVTATVTVVVEPAYPRLEITSSASNSAKVGVQYKYSMTVKGGRPNTDRTFALLKGPVGVSLSGAQLSWVPSKDQVGTQFISVTVTDGRSIVYQNWTVTVTKAQKASPGAGLGLIIGLILVVLVAIIAVVVMLVLRSKKRGGKGPRTDPPQGAEEQQQAPLDYETAQGPPQSEQAFLEQQSGYGRQRDP